MLSGHRQHSPAQTMRKEPSPRIIALTYVFRYSSLTPCSFSRRSVLITLIGDLSANCTPSVRTRTSPRHIRRTLLWHILTVYSRLCAEIIHISTGCECCMDASYEDKHKLSPVLKGRTLYPCARKLAREPRLYIPCKACVQTGMRRESRSLFPSSNEIKHRAICRLLVPLDIVLNGTLLLLFLFSGQLMAIVRLYVRRSSPALPRHYRPEERRLP